jgi:hypothetical protein
VALCCQVIPPIRRKVVNQIQDPFRVREVAVVKEEPRALLIRVLLDVVDALCVKGTRTADDSMDFVAFGEQQFREVRVVLSRDSRD